MKNFFPFFPNSWFFGIRYKTGSSSGFLISLSSQLVGWDPGTKSLILMDPFFPGKTGEGNTSSHSRNLLGVARFKNKYGGSQDGERVELNPQEMDWGRNFHHLTLPWWGESCPHGRHLFGNRVGLLGRNVLKPPPAPQWDPVLSLPREGDIFPAVLPHCCHPQPEGVKRLCRTSHLPRIHLPSDPSSLESLHYNQTGFVPLQFVKIGQGLKVGGDVY